MLASPPPPPRMAPGELRSPPPAYRPSQVVPMPLSPPPSLVGSHSGTLMYAQGRISSAGVNSGGGGGGGGGVLGAVGVGGGGGGHGSDSGTGVMDDAAYPGTGLEGGGGGGGTSSRSMHATTPRRSPYPQVGMGGSARDLRALPYYPGMASPLPAFQQQSLSLRSPGFMQSLKPSHSESSLQQGGGGDGPNTPTSSMDSPAADSGRRNSASGGRRSSGGGDRRQSVGSMNDTARSEPPPSTRRIRWADENNGALEEVRAHGCLSQSSPPLKSLLSNSPPSPPYTHTPHSLYPPLISHLTQQYCYFDEAYSPPAYISSERGMFSCLPWLCCTVSATE